MGLGSGEQEGLAQACSVGGGDVGAAVANQDGLGEIEVEVSGGAEEHAGAGLAVFVLAFVEADAVLGVVGAVVDGVERCALRGEFVRASSP